MSYELNDNSGSLFRNDNQTTDKHPTHKGQVKVGGVEYWVSAWVREGKKGKYFSLSFQDKDQPAAPKPKTHGERPGGPKNRHADEDSDIPW